MALAKGRLFSPYTREKMATSSIYKQAVQISKRARLPLGGGNTSMVETAKHLAISRSQVSKYKKNSKAYKEFTITKINEIENSSAAKQPS